MTMTQTTNRITYKSGYKYQLETDAIFETGIRPRRDVASYWYSLDTSGRMRIKRNYAWDGPSGPTFDTDNFMRGSLVHDVFYQMMGNQELANGHKDQIDRLLQKMCVEDGMSRIRAAWVYWAVKNYGKPSQPKDVIFAP